MSESRTEEYTRLVALEFKPGGKRYIYEAPPWGSNISAGDMVMTDRGVTAMVADAVTIDTDLNADVVRFIMSAAGATYPLKRIRAVMRDIADGRRWCDWPGWGDAAEAGELCERGRENGRAAQRSQEAAEAATERAVPCVMVIGAATRSQILEIGRFCDSIGVHGKFIAVMTTYRDKSGRR